MNLNESKTKNKGLKKLFRCPGCEKEFTGMEKIFIKDGLIFCPNCEVELKPIQFGTHANLIIADEFDMEKLKNIDIMLFDKGEYIGIVRTDKKIKDGAIMEVWTVVIDKSENLQFQTIDVLHVRDMDYAIVIPDHIAVQIRNVCDRNE